MITVNFNAKKMVKTINNIIDYSDGYIEESKKNETKIATKMAKISIGTFYQYLDGLARLHPEMLHHVYEWGEVGNPGSRLYQLKTIAIGRSVGVGAELLESTSIKDGSSEPFYDKASIMEYGETVTVTEKEAQSLFFEIDGVEYFRKGPITIANPGGEAVRGSFVKAFNDFYANYFSEVYLRSVGFYKQLQEAKEYKRNVRVAAKSSSPKNLGKNSAMQWIANIPGDDFIG
jgi:hypothetical protein